MSPNPNIPTGRQKRVTSGGSGVSKRGSGTGLGKVGSGSKIKVGLKKKGVFTFDKDGHRCHPENKGCHPETTGCHPELDSGSN